MQKTILSSGKEMVYSGDNQVSIAGIEKSQEGGIAISGHYGLSISGLGGRSISGKNGVSITGAYGEAMSAEGGRIEIEYLEIKKFRKVIGYIGENGLKPNVFYKVKNGKLVQSNYQFIDM